MTLMQGEMQLTQQAPNDLYDVQLADEEIIDCVRDLSSDAEMIRLLPNYGQRSTWLFMVQPKSTGKIW